MNLSSHALRRALDVTLQIQALSQVQASLLFDPHDANSLAVRIVRLGGYNVPRAVIRELLADVRRLIELNDAQAAGQHGIAGTLDSLATLAHHAETNSNREHTERLGVKALARNLRPALAVLADPHSHTAQEYVVAAGTLKDIRRACTPGQLLSKSLAHELGKTKADQLRVLLQTHELREAA